MAARSSRSLAFLMGALGTLVLTQGCVDDGVSMHVICSIPPAVEEDGCTWDPQGDTCVADGALNLRPGGFYRMTLRVESGLKPRAAEVPPIAEPNGVQIHSARIDLRTSDGRRILFGKELKNPYDVTASGYLAPNGINATTVEVIPSQYVASLRAPMDEPLTQIVAAIQLRGTTDGDVEVESGEFAWPIRLVRTSTVEAEGKCDKAEDVCPLVRGQDGFVNACTE
jgi:hypothetical protein